MDDNTNTQNQEFSANTTAQEQLGEIPPVPSVSTPHIQEEHKTPLSPVSIFLDCVKAYVIAFIICVCLALLEVIRQFIVEQTLDTAMLSTSLSSSVFGAAPVAIPTFFVLRMRRNTKKLKVSIFVFLAITASLFIGGALGLLVGALLYQASSPPDYAQFGSGFSGMWHAFFGIIIGAPLTAFVTYKAI